MIRTYYFSVAIILLSIFSCNKHSNEKKPPTGKIKVNISNTCYSFSNIFSEYEIIPIKGATLGKVKKLYTEGDKIIFTTHSGDHRVHIYDKKTEELKSIAKKGNGPEEFTTISDVFISSQIIHVLDMMKMTVRRYDLNGNFINAHKLPDYFDAIAVFDSLSIAGFKKVNYSSKEDKRINVLSKKGSGVFEIEKGFLPVPGIADERSFSQATALYTVNDTMRFTRPFSDTIYNVFKDAVEPQYLLDFSPHTLPYEWYYEDKLDLLGFVEKTKGSKHVWNINCVYENNTHLFFVFRYSNKIYSCFYDKRSGLALTSRCFEDLLFLNSPSANFSEEFFPAYLDDEGFYVVVEPYYLIEYMESMKRENYKEWARLKESGHPLHKISSKLSLADNPMIIRYKFREYE